MPGANQIIGSLRMDGAAAPGGASQKARARRGERRTRRRAAVPLDPTTA